MTDESGIGKLVIGSKIISIDAGESLKPSGFKPTKLRADKSAAGKRHKR